MSNETPASAFYEKLLQIVETEEAKAELVRQREPIIDLIADALQEGVSLGVQLDALTHSSGF